MIEWLTQRQADCLPPAPSWLTCAERQRLAALKTPKRRQDWLLGRWTAKRLLQAALARERGQMPPLNAVEIQAAADGSPQAAYLYAGRRVAAPPLSLSHSGGRALCALGSGLPACASLGADLERIEPRAPGFVLDFFAPAEIESVNRAPPQTRNLLVTAIWSAKEAALKALRLGLRLDTRAMVCQIQPVSPAPCAWTPLGLALDPARWPGTRPSLSGWWRTLPGYVLAIVVYRGSNVRPVTPDPTSTVSLLTLGNPSAGGS
jgi:4'-phosphopantetheinyl transferase